MLDGSRYDEFKPLYGSALTTGWGSIHGYRVGILANARGILFSEEAQKAAQFIQLANQKDVPLVFLHNTTGFMVGKDYEQGGIIKHGALMINAVSNSKVPHLGVIVGGSYGAANYAMSGRGYDPRFIFSWPNAQSSVMGPAQLAGVLDIVARGAAKARGQELDEEHLKALREAVEAQIANEQTALSNSGRGYDDAIIDPRDTRTVLGFALSVVHNNQVKGADGLRRLPDVSAARPRRQPGRDRAARVRDVPAPGHRHRRGLHRAGRGGAVRARGRRRDRAGRRPARRTSTAPR